MPPLTSRRRLFTFTRPKLPWKKTGPVALVREHLFQFVREHLFEYMQCEPKDNDEVAHQQLPRNFAISFEAKMV